MIIKNDNIMTNQKLLKSIILSNDWKLIGCFAIWTIFCTMAALLTSVTGSPAQSASLRAINNSQRVQMHLVDAKMGTSTNVSVEDRMWKIAAACLRAKFGQQFLANKDIKCASSQVVLTLSRMQRAACKSCEPYFHCRAFSSVQVRCRNNYDVQRTIDVIRTCRPLYTMGDDDENTRAIDDALSGIECTKVYLCRANCRYNPTDATCPHNQCPRNNYTITNNNQRQHDSDVQYSIDNLNLQENSWPSNNSRNRHEKQQMLLHNKALPLDSPHKLVQDEQKKKQQEYQQQKEYKQQQQEYKQKQTEMGQKFQIGKSSHQQIQMPMSSFQSNPW